jgi:hypothetical protein
MRASAIVETAGIPTVSLVCDGFAGQAGATASGLGFASLALARLVGHVDSQSVEALRANVAAITTTDVLRGLTQTGNGADTATLHAPGDIVARGTFDEINELFEANGWGDGLPIVPPTSERVSAFLEYTTDAPDWLIGVMRSSGVAATVHNVAVNGVMAGCRPDYMPILVAIAEVLTDPRYGSEHSGDTTSGETQVILSGPAVKAFGFNACEGALRDGYKANTSIGRFVRLFLRNVANFLPGDADKSTFGHTFRVVLAEDNEVLTELGWSTFSEDRGFDKDDSVVTIGRHTGDTVMGSVFGTDPETILRYLADGLVRQYSWEFIFVVGFAPGTSRPLVVISPLIAATLARAGLSKQNVQSGLFEYARIPARVMERYLGAWTNFVPGRQTLGQMVANGTTAPIYARSDDPERLVPVVAKAEDILIVVSGDPGRSNAMAHGSNGMHGFPTSARVRLA